MIVSFLLSMFQTFIVGLVLLLPTGHLPQGITDAFTYFMGILNAYSFVVPVDTLLQAAAVVLIFDGSMFIWYAINWTLRKIPGMQ